MKFSFQPGEWENRDLTYIYSWRFPELGKFQQEADCIINKETPGAAQPYDYVGLIVPETGHVGSKITARCSFEDLAAPMLVLADRNEVDENGVFRTLDLYEVVIWRNGLNVWRLQTENRIVSHYLVMGATFPLEEGKIHTLSAEIQEKRLLIQVNDWKFDLYIPELADSFRMGYNACEGFCRLYEMEAQI